MDALLETPDEIVRVCAEARRLAPADSPSDLPPSPITPEVPAWHRFEHEAWAIGETVRQSLSKKPALRRHVGVQRAILETINTPQLRRGRQSFIMALGFTAAASHAPALLPLLKDSDVDGHVVDTLLKMRVHSFDAEVRPLLDANQAWIRRLARQYIVRNAVAS
jgi:hypothetical protein